MIRELRIIDLGIIADASLEPGPGLTVITGETGAGKTMLLQGLDLLRGARADVQLIRSGATETVIECDLEIEPPELREALAEAGGMTEDDGSALIVRVVSPKRSRFLVGGRSVPRIAVAQTLDAILTVHGQSDQIRLRDGATQRDTIDHFAGPRHLAVLDQYRSCWHDRGEVRTELDELVHRQAERAREAELLRLGLAQVEQVAPQPGEDAELEAVAERLRHAEELRDLVSTAYRELAGDDFELAGANGQIGDAVRALERAHSMDKGVSAWTQHLQDLGFQLSDLATQLAGYISDLEVEPGRLDAIEERRSELAKLSRSYGPTIEDVLTWTQEASKRLLELDDDTHTIETLRARLAHLDDELARLSGELTTVRKQAAARLSAQVDEELSELAMASAHLEIEVDSRAEYGPHGADTVTMMFAAHPEAPMRPLAKAASGGELSRVMLAIEVTIADGVGDGPIRPAVMVFDEIDAGVGGRTATHIGRRLARLAQVHQVIVITHLAQVAAFAQTHLVVRKDEATGTVVTTVSQVSGDDRAIELARMLSGEEESDAARTHARELLAAAGGGEESE